MFDVHSCHYLCYPESNLGVIKTYVGMQTCLPELNWPLGNAVSWAEVLNMGLRTKMPEIA